MVMSKEIFVVLIINRVYIRWEIFNEHTTIGDVFKLLKNKYNIKKCIVEINDLYLDTLNNSRLQDICPNGTSIYITTSKKYRLCKSIF
jgi:hypothetical protein